MSVVKKLKLISFLDGLYFSTIITNLYVLAQGVPLYHAVLAQSVYSGAVLLSEVPTGVIADKFGRKVSMAAGYFMNVIGLVVLILWPNVIGLYVMNIIRGIGSALISGADEALLYESAQKDGLNYQKQSSAMLSNGVIGLSIAGIIAGGVYSWLGNGSFVPLLAATAILQFVVTIISLSIHEVTGHHASIKKREQKVWHMLAQTISLMRKNRTILALTLVGLLTISNEYFLYGTYGPRLVELQVNNFWVGAVFTLGLLINFVLQRNVYKLEKYLTFERASALIKSGTIIGYFGLALISQNTLVILLFISIIGVFNLEKPLVSDYTNQELDSSIRATVLSGMSLASRLTRMGLTLVLGVAVAKGSIESAYLVSGLLITIGLAISYWLLVKCGCVNRFEAPRKSHLETGNLF